jgi:hypothetical protein
MKLVSMKRDKKELKEAQAPMPPADEYPYGLELRLGDDELEKLGMKESLPEGGVVMKVMALAKVTEVRVKDDENGKSCRLTLQVTDLHLTPNEADALERAQGLYGKGK